MGTGYMKVEAIALVMNIGITMFYIWQWNEPGKILYWTGACLVTVGLIFMKG